MESVEYYPPRENESGMNEELEWIESMEKDSDKLIDEFENKLEVKENENK